MNLRSFRMQRGDRHKLKGAHGRGLGALPALRFAIRTRKRFGQTPIRFSLAATRASSC
jgi:hypothetical protein